MLGPFIVLGNCLECRTAVLNGTPVAVAAYKEASAFALLQVHKINNIIHQGTLGVFENAPSIVRIFYPDVVDPKPPSSKRGHQQTSFGDDFTTISDLTSTIPRRDQQSTTSQSAGSSQSASTAATRKSEGVMKRSTLGGKPPVPKALMSHPISGKMTYVCANASTVGYACLRTADECRFIHVNKPQDLKRQMDRTALKLFIANHVDLSLARPGTS